jgi:hypothetical protein
MAGAEVSGKRFLEGLCPGAERQPARAQRVRDRLEILRLEAQIEERQLGSRTGGSCRYL